VLVHWFWQQRTVPQWLEIEIQTERAGTLQFFMDVGAGIREEDSVRRDLPGQPTPVLFRIDLAEVGVIRTLRFDPVNHDGLFVLHRLQFKRQGFFLADDLLLHEYASSHQIDRWLPNTREQTLQVIPHPGSHDPHFLVPGEFSPVSKQEMMRKWLLVQSAVAVLALGLSWWQRQWVREGLRWLLFLLGLPFQGIKWLMRSYSRWIDRVSQKAGLVHPTSCVIGGLVVAVLFQFYFEESIKKWETPRPAVFAFSMTSAESKSFEVFGDAGSVHRILEVDPTERRFEFPLKLKENKVSQIRIDPIEERGHVIIRNAQIISPEGRETPVSLEGWAPNRWVQIVSEDSQKLVLESVGDDPYLRSPDLGIVFEPRKTLPARWLFAACTWFLVAVGLLLWNHLILEGLSLQERSERMGL
jgi:hypothetical protein